MKAIIAQGADALRYADKPTPTPGPDQVLVQVYAAGVNPVDWKMLRQASAAHPLTPGCDFSGVVTQVGAGVSRFTRGAEVYGSVGPIPAGTYAEYVLAPAEEVAFKPRTLNHAEAAAVPVAATTAWQALFDHAHLQAGQRVLVHAAAGGVGHLAVQLARWKGAYIVGTASAPNREFVLGLGADEVIDYTTVAFEQQLRDLDVVFDTVGGGVAARSWSVLKPGGYFVSAVGAANEQQAQAHRVRSANFQTRPDAEQLVQLALLLDEGTLRVHLQQTFPLAAAAAAHALSQQGHVRGKLALTMDVA